MSFRMKAKRSFFSTHITTDLEKVADYITFIIDGKVVASEETDELLEAYSLVKGPKSAEPQVKTARPIALKETSLGFEAFMEGSEARLLASKPNLRLERPSLEEIMYYMVKSGKQN